MTDTAPTAADQPTDPPLWSPSPSGSVSTWLKKNLFRSRLDGVVTVVAGTIILIAGFRFLRFVFVTGRWQIVRENLSLYLTGSWPEEHLWRLVVVVVGLALIAGFIGGFSAGRIDDDPSRAVSLAGRDRLVDLGSRLWPLVVTVALLLALTTTIGPLLVAAGAIVAAVAGNMAGRAVPGGMSAVPVVVGVLFLTLAGIWLLNAGLSWNSWGGMVLNLSLATISIALCFPIGVLLALARRSEYPILRWLSTGYIELFRGVPLIGLLLMANVALGFFIPNSLAPGKVVRAIVIFVLFTSAYIAEIVRGGLQSVPPGQIEAGKANGLTPIPIITRIVLPQAIRNVIPALVGQFISLFKDTTLAGAAMGLTDLLGGAEASTAQADFRGQGLIAETLVFVLLIFWAGSYTMSRESQRLETKLGVGER